MDNESILNDLNKNGFVFKKQFGQNFITDKNLLGAIVKDANLKKDDDVLEIGSGAGTLTQNLSESVNNVVSVEIDKTLTEFLEKKFENTNVKIICADFMKLKSENINSMFNNRQFKVVANLPYYITTPIIFKLVEEQYNISTITIMIQKEVAQRLCAQPNSKDYGIITVMLNAIADVCIKRIVNREVFNPVPSVDSALIQIKINRTKYGIKNYFNFQKIVKQSFAMRRKTLYNNLKTILTKEEIERLYNQLKLNNNVRAENLSVAQFVFLANQLN